VEAHIMSENINVSIDKDIKNQAEFVLASYGMTIPEAINLFLTQTAQNKRPALKPNAATLAAMAESEKMLTNPENYNGYNDLDKLFEDLGI
jgi:addiction module RelB/DinJ family antitoxin